MEREFAPRVTVAAVVERAGRFLMVEEETAHGIAYNQPAGHLEAGESLTQGAVRETLEESAYHFTPRGLLGVYLITLPPKASSGAHAPAVTYLRFAFAGDVEGPEPGRALDQGIRRALWLSAAEIEALRPQHRSPVVWQCIADFASGRPLGSLDLLTHLPGAAP